MGGLLPALGRPDRFERGFVFLINRGAAGLMIGAALNNFRLPLPIGRIMGGAQLVIENANTRLDLAGRHLLGLLDRFPLVIGQRPRRLH